MTSCKALNDALGLLDPAADELTLLLDFHKGGRSLGNRLCGECGILVVQSALRE
jgi:hypothetical protein